MLFAKVRELDPRLGIVWLNVLSQLLDSGKTPQFRTEYARALATLADDPDALNLVALSRPGSGAADGDLSRGTRDRAGRDLDLALQATIFPLIMVEDYVGARTLAELARRRGGTPERTLYYLLHLAAASGDWVAVDASPGTSRRWDW